MIQDAEGVWSVTLPGNHECKVWRRNLASFVQLIFQRVLTLLHRVGKVIFGSGYIQIVPADGIFRDLTILCRLLHDGSILVEDFLGFFHKDADFVGRV